VLKTNPIKEKIAVYAGSFEEKLEAEFTSLNKEYASVVEACKYSLLLGGKRLRPFLIRSFYELCGGKDDGSFGFEAAIECIHTYSLIHDDLPCMDNDVMRRGKPSCHIRFGESTALLAGDALLTKAFSLAAKANTESAETKLRALSVLSDLAGIDGMIGGQIVDLLYEEKVANEEVLKLICSLKTGALIKASCVIGCILANAPEEKISAAANYAENIGLAFQIVDDILDETSTEDKLGKPIHSDKDNNKSTFVSLFGIEKCKSLVDKLTDSAKDSLSVFGDKAEDLKQLADYLCNRDY